MKEKNGLPGTHFLLNNGAKIPAIGLGTWQSGGDLCVDAVKTALSIGYRQIDCAHLYGNEVEVGEALAEAFKGSMKRADVFLTSKLYCTMNSINKIENSVRVSLKNLGVEYLDLYLMHWPDSSAFGDATDPPSKSGSVYRQFLSRLKKAWKDMEGLVELGLVKAIGISNFSVQQIKELLKFAKIIPAVNQDDEDRVPEFLLAYLLNFLVEHLAKSGRVIEDNFIFSTRHQRTENTSVYPLSVKSNPDAPKLAREKLLLTVYFWVIRSNLILLCTWTYKLSFHLYHSDENERESWHLGNRRGTFYVEVGNRS